MTKNIQKITKKKISKRSKEYRKTHKIDKTQNSIYLQRRRALKNKLPATLTFEQWEQIKKDFDYKCAYCGEELPLSQDHFIALSKGGEYTHNNIIPACRRCNSSKGNKDFFEWFIEQESYSEKREKFILKYLHYTNNREQQLSLAI